MGFLSIALGVIDIFLPVLPTTPFLLLAVACFMRNSSHFYHWLTGRPRLGLWIRNYFDGEGILLRGRVHAIGLMWTSIALPCYLIRCPWAQGFTLTSTVLVDIYILRQKIHPPHDA